MMRLANAGMAVQVALALGLALDDQAAFAALALGVWAVRRPAMIRGAVAERARG